MGSISKTVGSYLSEFLIHFVGNRWPGLTGDPELLAMIVGFIVGALLTWLIYWLIHKGKINGLNSQIRGLEATIASLKGEQGILERQKKDLEDKLRETTEQKQITLTKSTVKVYNTPISPNEIIYPSSDGVLWRWDPVLGAQGPFCPNHPQERLGLQSKQGKKWKGFEKDYLSFNWFVCPSDSSEDFTSLKHSSHRVHHLRTEATDRFRSRYGQKDQRTSWSGVCEIEHLDSEVRWRETNGRDFRPLSDSLPYGAELFLQIRAKITVTPPRLVESILLDLTGKLLEEWDWAPEPIDQQEFLFRFKLNPPVTFGKRTAYLAAKGLGPDATLMEKRSQRFEIIIAGSILDYQRFQQ